MKRTLLFCLMTLLCLLLLISCGGNNTPAASDTQPDGTPADTQPEAPTEAAAQSESGTKPETLPETQPGTEPETQPAPEVTVPAVYPTPGSISAAPGTAAAAVPCAAIAPGSGAADYADELTAMGFAVNDGGLPLTVTVEDMSGSFDACPDEGYVLTVTADGIDVRAGSDRGVYYALLTLAQLRTDGSLPAVTVTDAPTMPIRGVIEGFYGVAWTHEYRLELFGFMGKYKMNTYMYAPKDDPKHRARWREMYTGEELERMQELIDTAAANRVKFVYALSPGLDFNLGSGYDKDFAALCDKCDSMYRLGVRDFAILLDDIPTLDAAGHARLLNDFLNVFCKTHEGVSNPIAITPEFCDAMLTDYTDKLAPQLDADIEMMWTGAGVIPASITNASLRNIQRKYGRRVLIWWNYPVNDGQSNNLYMDAARGLGNDLDKSVTGLLSNPMNQGHASMTPLFTIADYLWNPAAYQPDASLEAAVRALYPDCADALLTFVDLTGASPMNGYAESKTVSRTLDAFRRKRDAANTAALREIFADMERAAACIRGKAGSALVTELDKWLSKMENFARMGQLYCDMETAYAADSESPALLGLVTDYIAERDKAAANGTSVSPSVLAPFFAEIAPRINEMMGFTGGSSAPGLSTNLPTYESYVLENAQNSDTGSWFWSAGAPDGNSYIQINLGRVQHIDLIRLRSGVGGHNDDYIHSGELVYSEDGKTWKTICKVTTPNIDKQVDINAQYIRLKCLATQQFWVTVGEFSAISTESTGDTFTLDTPFVSEMMLLSLNDRNLLNGFTADPAKAEGHTLTVSTAGCTSLRILFTGLPENHGLTVEALSADGTARAVEPLPDTRIDCTGIDRVVITFGAAPVTVGEIVIK